MRPFSLTSPVSLLAPRTNTRRRRLGSGGEQEGPVRLQQSASPDSQHGLSLSLPTHYISRHLHTPWYHSQPPPPLTGHSRHSLQV